MNQVLALERPHDNVNLNINVLISTVLMMSLILLQRVTDPYFSTALMSRTMKPIFANQSVCVMPWLDMTTCILSSCDSVYNAGPDIKGYAWFATLAPEKNLLVLVGWLCLTSHQQRGHLETAPPFTVPCWVVFTHAVYGDMHLKDLLG